MLSQDEAAHAGGEEVPDEPAEPDRGSDSGNPGHAGEGRVLCGHIENLCKFIFYQVFNFSGVFCDFIDYITCLLLCKIFLFIRLRLLRRD